MTFSHSLNGNSSASLVKVNWDFTFFQQDLSHLVSQRRAAWIRAVDDVVSERGKPLGEKLDLGEFPRAINAVKNKKHKPFLGRRVGVFIRVWNHHDGNIGCQRQATPHFGHKKSVPKNENAVLIQIFRIGNEQLSGAYRKFPLP